MIKAIIFDCFGVLYPDGSKVFFQKHQALFGRNASFLDKLNIQIDLGKITRAQYDTELEKEIGMPADKITAGIDNELILDQRLVEFIRDLKKTYKIGMLTNAGQETLSIIYRDQIDKLFDVVTASYEVGVVKPNPKIFLVCTQRLNVEPTECLFIDDNINNVEAAQKLGMKTIHYTDFNSFGKIITEILMVK